MSTDSERWNVFLVIIYFGSLTSSHFPYFKFPIEISDLSYFASNRAANGRLADKKTPQTGPVPASPLQFDARSTATTPVKADSQENHNQFPRGTFCSVSTYAFRDETYCRTFPLWRLTFPYRICLADVLVVHTFYWRRLNDILWTLISTQRPSQM